MSPLRIVCLLIGMITLVSANNLKEPMRWSSSRNSIKDNWRPIDSMSVFQLESMPSMNSLTLEMLEGLSVQEGADLINRMYHLSQAGRAMKPTYVPEMSEISCYLMTPENKKLNFKLNELPRIAEQQNNFGREELTIFIAGLPQRTESVKNATHKLVEAYMQRYNGQGSLPQNTKYQDNGKENENLSSSEEDYATSSVNRRNKPSGNLIVIELGNALHNMHEYASLNVEQTGIEMGNLLVDFSDMSNTPHENIHVIASNIGAHVAGAAGRQFTHRTGHQLRRITGLDPSKIYAQHPQMVTGLARGDAEFVDAIHTSAYGMGTITRCGDIDFYPNGPGEGVPGADNVVEASMRAIHYFAESVVPGNEHNFPAVCANSLEEYKHHNGYGIIVCMGINADHDIKGDFVLQVNSKSPFGRSLLAPNWQKYHNVHKPLKLMIAQPLVK